MKNLFLIGACLLAFGSTPVLAQAGGPQVAYVTVEDNGNLHLIICRGAGKSEDVDVPAKTIRQTPHVREETIQGVLTKLLAEGYSLASSTSAGDHYIFRSTFIFTKPQ